MSDRRESFGQRAFDSFVFLEYDKSKIRLLRERIAHLFPSQLEKCHFIIGDTNETLPALLKELDWRHDRAVTFLDPCATQLEWATIQAFKGTCSDVWLLFPLSSVLRMLPREGLPSEGCSKKLTRLFGTSSWMDIYKDKQTNQLTLFETDQVEVYRTGGYEELLSYITVRYETVFSEICGSAVLKTAQNAPIFALYSMIANESKRARETSRKISRHLIKQLEE